MTPKRAEHCAVLQRPQVPVIRVFQSVSFSLNRQVVAPPLEILDQGRVVPGKWATTHPCRKGTTQLPLAWPLAMPKLQEDSVVAVESPKGEAAARSKRNQPKALDSTTGISGIVMK